MRTVLLLGVTALVCGCSGEEYSYCDNNPDPYAGNDTYTVAEDQVLDIDAGSGVLANDANPCGSPLTASATTDPEHGTATLAANGSFTYTPNAEFSGEDSFSYVAGDGQRSTPAATVTITVTTVDDPPIAADDTYSVNEDTPLNVNAAGGLLANDSDVDSPSLTASLVADASHGSATVAADGSFTYTPAADYAGTDTFTYQASDGSLASDGTVTITVNNVNDAPVATDSSFSTDVDTAALEQMVASDADRDWLTYSVVANPSHGTITFMNPSDGAFEYDPDSGYQGSDSFTFRANDGTADSNVATVSIVVGLPVPFSIQGDWIDMPLTQTANHAWPYVMSLEDGRFLAVWSDQGTGVYTIFDSSGTRVLDPAELVVDEADREFPSGGVFSDGRFVLAYRYYLDGSHRGIRALRFTAEGTPIGSELIVYPGTQQAESVSLAVLADDSFVVAYENRTAGTSVLRRFDDDGVQLGTDTTLPESDRVVSIAALPLTGFVLVFQSSSQGDTVTRIFNNQMVQQSTLSFDANLSLTFGSQNKLATFPNGEFAVAGADTTTLEVWVLRYNADNTHKNTTLIATTTQPGAGAWQSITAVDNGFFVTWEDNDYRTHGRLYDEDDNPVGDVLTLFDHADDRTFISDTWTAYYDDVLFVTGYDMDSYDTFLRRLTRP